MLDPRINLFSGLKIAAMSKSCADRLPDREPSIDTIVSELFVHVKLDFGTAIRLVIGGDTIAEALDVILNPSDEGVHGRNTLTHVLERKSHTLRVPSCEPLASKQVDFVLTGVDVKSAGSSNASDTTAFA